MSAATGSAPIPAPVWAIVAYRDSPVGKSRLGGAYSAEFRREFSQGMLADVLAALAGARGVAAIMLVGEDAPAHAASAGAAHAKLVSLVSNEPLNPALAQAVAAARAAGAKGVLIVHADQPTLTSEEVDAFIDAARGSMLRIAPCLNREGTNVLFAADGVELRFNYGPGSFARHCADYAADGVAVSIAPPVLDIDTPADVERLRKTLARDPDLAANARRVLRTRDMRFAPRLPASAEVLGWVDLPGAALAVRARAIRDQAFGAVVTYSRKVFLPVTHLCRDVCHYCTFARTPRRVDAPYMSEADVLEVARRGAAMGCKEALFTLGDQPELRYRAAREALDGLGFASTLDYVRHLAKRVLEETGLLPHINAGIMNEEQIRALRGVSASMGLMLESASERLGERGQPHFGSPDKVPTVRLATIQRAGVAQVPFTSGILIGIGETRLERLQSLLALRRLHGRYGHLQEIIIQNFRAKPDTVMAQAPEPDLDELVWTIAAARLVFGSTLSIQVPPNLTRPDDWLALLNAGADDLGGISPLTPDFVNPESPWPHLAKLETALAAEGLHLCERLTAHPRFVAERSVWVDSAVIPALLKLADAGGLARDDDWRAGISEHVPAPARSLILGRPRSQAGVELILDRVSSGDSLGEREIVRLFEARGADYRSVVAAADELRRRMNGAAVGFVVNRNINYTNVCTYHCGFCAFSTGKVSLKMREKPYRLDLDEVVARGVEAAARGATELCLQGGIHPSFTGETYLEICRAVRAALPDMHIHAFSPLEVMHGAGTLSVSVKEFLARLQRAGLNTLPGTAAEILDDEIRAVICPDKLNTREWLGVMSDAHSLGLRSTATIMFGHMESPKHWARHLTAVRALQDRSGGFTEFVPLAFVAEGSPIYRRGRARPGPTFREAILMHAVARLALHPAITNIQASWVKLGAEGAQLCLAAGANDMGGTLMNESISRAAGAKHGQEFTREKIEELIAGAGRRAYQRTTLYRAVREYPQELTGDEDLPESEIFDDAGSAAFC